MRLKLPEGSSQLRYFKIHGKWLAVLTVISVLLFIWGVIEVLEFKRNNTDLHRRVKQLERERGRE